MLVGVRKDRGKGQLRINKYTLLYLKWKANRNLLYSTGNAAQCYVAAWMGGESRGEGIHVYVCLSPFVRGSTLTGTTHPGQTPQSACMSCFRQEVPGRNRKLISHHQPEALGNGQKETPHVRPPPRILLARLLLAEQGVHHQEGTCIRMIG